VKSSQISALPLHDFHSEESLVHAAPQPQTQQVSLILTTLSLALHVGTVIYVGAIGLLVDLNPNLKYGNDRRRLQTGPGRVQEAAQARRKGCLCLHYAFRPPKGGYQPPRKAEEKQDCTELEKDRSISSSHVPVYTSH
jgi:hypothetical protein